MTAMDEFRRLHKTLEKMAAYRFSSHPLTAGRDQAIKCLWRLRFGRKKMPAMARAVEALGDEAAALDASYRRRADAISKRYHDKINRVGERLEALAGQVQLEPSEAVWTQFATTWDYHTQTQPTAYSRAEAELLHAAKARLAGLEVHVRRTPYGFEVWANTDAEGAEILRRRSIPLRDLVKAAWGSGINPRVLCPFLPPDYEEAAGLDHFGREKVRA